MTLTPELLPWIALAGALGAAARYLLDRWCRLRWDDRFPWGTVIVNLLGAFLAGLVLGWVLTGYGDPALGVILSIGFLGAFTTFSTWMVDVAGLAQEGRWRASALHLLGSLVFGLMAAALGLLLGMDGCM